MKRLNLSNQAQMWFLGNRMNGDCLQEEIQDIRRAILPKLLVLDLRRVKKADSSGLAWLVNLNIRSRESGDSLILLDPSPMVKALLNKARIKKQFWIIPNIKEAQQILLENRVDFGQLKITSEN